MDKINSVLTKIIHIERSFAVSESGLHPRKLQNLFYFQSQVNDFSFICNQVHSLDNHKIELGAIELGAIELEKMHVFFFWEGGN